MTTIEKQLAARKAQLIEAPKRPFAEFKISKEIVRVFPSFYKLKNILVHGPRLERYLTEEDLTLLSPLLKEFLQRGWIQKSNSGQFLSTDHKDAFAFIKGAWLEEYVYYIAESAGMDELLFGQKIGYTDDYGKLGKNEIDVIARRGDRFLLISCKTDAPFDFEDRNAELTKEAQEVGSWIRHFFPNNAFGALITTSDVIDEANNIPRFTQARTKANYELVDILGLEDLEPEKLQRYFSEDRNWDSNC